MNVEPAMKMITEQADMIARLLARNTDLEAEVTESRHILHGIWEIICEEFGTIEYNIMKGCRCLRCNEYQVRSLDNEIIARGDTLKELVDNYYEQARK